MVAGGLGVGWWGAVEEGEEATQHHMKAAEEKKSHAFGKLELHV